MMPKNKTKHTHSAGLDITTLLNVIKFRLVQSRSDLPPGLLGTVLLVNQLFLDLCHAVAGPTSTDAPCRQLNILQNTWGKGGSGAK